MSTTVADLSTLATKQSRLCSTWLRTDSHCCAHSLEEAAASSGLRVRAWNPGEDMYEYSVGPCGVILAIFRP